jgi:hypothetical protein
VQPDLSADAVVGRCQHAERHDEDGHTVPAGQTCSLHSLLLALSLWRRAHSTWGTDVFFAFFVTSTELKKTDTIARQLFTEPFHIQSLISFVVYSPCIPIQISLSYFVKEFRISELHLLSRSRNFLKQFLTRDRALIVKC